jgi:cell division septation protein DedD
MRGVFDEKELDQGRRPRDTELTLGPSTLLAIFFGVVLLCGLFFGLGYAVGHSGSSDSSASIAAAPSASPASGSRSKPSATASNVPQPPPQQRAVVNIPAASPGEATAAVQSSAAPAANQPAIKPALPQADYQPAAQPVPPPRVEPALASSVPLMVQIAAVSHPEDAEVLVGALRKRGYAVSIHRVPTDALIHVQIGPFKTRDEAIRWRQRLLDDGYNAIVQ